MSYQRRYFSAIASRSAGAPQVIAYWLMSPWIAAQAASFIGSGIGKSGKPCARLIAPCWLRDARHLADDGLGEGRGSDGRHIRESGNRRQHRLALGRNHRQTIRAVRPCDSTSEQTRGTDPSLPLARGAGFVACLAIAPLAGAVAQMPPASGGRALAVEDFYRVKTVAAPEISPDGRWASFSVMTKVEATNGETGELWLVPTDGSSAARRVSPEGTSAGGGRWSSDGRLCFSAAGKTWSVSPASAQPDSVSPCDAGARGGRTGAGGRISLATPDGKWTASLRDMAPARRERTYASEFEKRHEERFKGAQFDWLDFQRDGQPFPVPNRARSRRQSAAGDLPRAVTVAPSAS